MLFRSEGAQNVIDKNWDRYVKADYLPLEEIKPDPRSGIRNYGILYWYQYFSKRQLLVFVTLIENIEKITKRITNEEYRKVITTYLTLILGKQLDANSYGVHWHTGTDGPELTLAFRRTNFVFNHAEPNPFGKVRGNLYSILNDIVNGVKFCVNSDAFVQVSFESVLNLDNGIKFDIIFADPPNANDIQFAEQSEFFYVWMSKILCKHYRELPQKISTDEDLSDSPGRFGDRKLALVFYEKGLTRALEKMNFLLKEDGILLFYFSLSHQSAWKMLVNVLHESQFQVTNLLSIHFENVTNVMPQISVENLGTILLSCRKLLKKESIYFEDILNLIESKIRERLDKLTLNELVLISISDLFIVALEKTLEIVTKYSEIKSYQKNLVLDIDGLVNEIQKLIAFYLFSRITTNSVGTLGNQIAFYIFVKTFYDKVSLDEVNSVSKYFGLDHIYLKSKNMIVEEEGFYRLSRLDEFLISDKPQEISSENLYDQLLFAYQKINDIKSKKTNLKNYENFKIEKILNIAQSLIQIKSILGQYDSEMQNLNSILESF